VIAVFYFFARAIQIAGSEIKKALLPEAEKLFLLSG
jgi:hypothetical protein